MAYTITFGGDLMLGRSFDSRPKYPWTQGVLDLVKDTLFCVNLETAVTAATEKWPNKTFNYKVRPEIFAQLLPGTAIAMNLANNHILDYKKPGLEETVTTLTRLDIPYTGLANGPVKIFTYASGLIVGMLGFSDHPAEWKDQGVSYLNIDTDVWDVPLALIRDTAAKVHVLIIYLHFGPNWVKAIPLKLKQWCQACITAGARVVVNTSAHHVLPVERYGAGLILYSPGAVVDDYAIDKDFRNDLGLLVQVTFDAHGAIVDGGMYPTKIEDMTVRLLRSDEPDYKWVTGRLSST